MITTLAEGWVGGPLAGAIIYKEAETVLKYDKYHISHVRVLKRARK